MLLIEHINCLQKEGINMSIQTMLRNMVIYHQSSYQCKMNKVQC
ncbi:unnamed protein product [Paramecium sonneborni]|uniref:Uncharacterized protein n=1 Tax=Paramecium sonneborni TaxID=65129 RepID=A0A8S1MFJ6_9CILI|nr:unnamed protein product [Paramecium sonneborni]